MAKASDYCVATRLLPFDETEKGNQMEHAEKKESPTKSTYLLAPRAILSALFFSSWRVYADKSIPNVLCSTTMYHVQHLSLCVVLHAHLKRIHGSGHDHLPRPIKRQRCQLRRLGSDQGAEVFVAGDHHSQHAPGERQQGMGLGRIVGRGAAYKSRYSVLNAERL